MSTAEKIFHKTQSLPEEAQGKLLDAAEKLARQYSVSDKGPLAAWEEDWNAPGMEAYDRA